MISFITIVKPVSWVLSFIPAYDMRAAGDVKFSMITSCCTMWLCRVSLCIYLCRVWGFGPDCCLDRYVFPTGRCARSFSPSVSTPGNG